MIKRIYTGLKRRLDKYIYDSTAIKILKTSPIQCDKKSNLCIVSMVSSKDLYMYLVAIKSFYHFLQMGRVVILNDGSLTEDHLALLKAHIKSLEIHNIQDVDTGKCPKRNCWERLFLILKLSKENYVIQLDSDTVTVSEVDEVKKAINGNKGFALPTSNNGFISIKEISDIMKNWDSDFVQVVAEKNMYKLKIDETDHLKYIRANAAFAGFPKGNINVSFVEKFSKSMEKAMGKTWNDWGSEQVASNFVIANTKDPTVLPAPKYTGYYPKGSTNFEKSTFLHFIGTQRFKNGYYIKKTKQILKIL